jgi:hypothetical protein
MGQLLTTRMRHPSQWCEKFQEIIDEESFQVTGKWVTIDLKTIHRAPDCGGRQWQIVKAEFHDPGPVVCEHNIEIGD